MLDAVSLSLDAVESLETISSPLQEASVMHASNEAIDKYAFFIEYVFSLSLLGAMQTIGFLSNNELTILPIGEISIKILHISKLLKKSGHFEPLFNVISRFIRRQA